MSTVEQPSALTPKSRFFEIWERGSWPAAANALGKRADEVNELEAVLGVWVYTF